VKDGSVYGTAKVLDTPYGRSLKTLLECSDDNGLSSLYLALRGFSESVLEDTIAGNKKVPDKAYHFISFDICMDYDIKKENGSQ
jgi:hypothetical protein